jgi:hypothetical protein
MGWLLTAWMATLFIQLGWVNRCHSYGRCAIF